MKTPRTTKKHQPLIIGNWKMNPKSLTEADMLAGGLAKSVPKTGPAAVYAAPPYPFLDVVGKKLRRTRISLGAQDTSTQDSGAYTGQVGVPMLKSMGVEIVILGHSERRALGEANEEVAQKTRGVLKSGLIAVACIGEKKRDRDGNYFNEIEAQLRAILEAITASSLGRFVIAYEPVWAIGTGKHATAEDVQEMKLFIQKVISDTQGRKAVGKVRILYGGSVNKDNAEELLTIGEADGFLIGGASLKALEFSAVVHIADTYARS